ncbi:DNA glycosylase AlkZ-like family protein [uncultured Friedmanniella sp.]|uniref:DNA glycosylase AlkZ-like family protein n=1 Tax=uncultured Friedmanniella sp. TaxID=335381 RepID=UPI0035CC785B
MTRWNAEDLRAATLGRQFPERVGTGPEDVLALFAHLGPVQSQVPRAPFLTASSRAPGGAYPTVRDLFAAYRLVKTSSLRGTVHTTVAGQYAWVDAVARNVRSRTLARELGLTRRTAAQVEAELESYADVGWRSRAELVAHLRSWLVEHESSTSATRLTGTYRENLVWGHSGLLRRPPDERWEKRTDVLHRRASALLPGLEPVSPAAALTELTRVHLRAAGPLTRRDLAWFSGSGLAQVDAAVASLGEEVLRGPGPGEEEYVDLAEPPPVRSSGLGVRLLPEYDALLVGYHQSHRHRFLSPSELDAVWSKVNGQCAPLVLHDDRVVGTWRTVARGRGTEVEVTLLPGHRAPPEDELGAAAGAAAAGLGLELTSVGVRR